MKGYFNRLADRATATRVTSPAAAGPLRDPFEAVATETPIPPRGEQGGLGMADAGREHSLAAPSPWRGPSLTLRQSPPPTDGWDQTETTEARPPLQRPIEDDANAIALEEPFRLRRGSDAPSAAPTHSTDSTPLVPPLSASPSPLAAAEPAASDTASLREDTLDALRQQTLLLRKADAFMGGLLERRHASADAPAEPASATREDDRPNAASLANRAIGREPSRPADNAFRTARSEPDQPQVVIGSLTVEVMPPAAPPAPARRVVIVREGRSRSHGPGGPGKRFGLGQF